MPISSSLTSQRLAQSIDRETVETARVALITLANSSRTGAELTCGLRSNEGDVTEDGGSGSPHLPLAVSSGLW